MKINRTKIETVMAENQLTLSQLSMASGIAKQNISTIMRRGTCTPRTAGRIAAGLQLPVAAIVREEDGA